VRTPNFCVYAATTLRLEHSVVFNQWQTKREQDTQTRVLLLWPWPWLSDLYIRTWPRYLSIFGTQVQLYGLSSCTCVPKINFVGQGVQAIEHCGQTDTHIDNDITTPHSRMVIVKLKSAMYSLYILFAVAEYRGIMCVMDFLLVSGLSAPFFARCYG